MAVSSDVVQNAQALATDYNKLREDVLDNATGHEHTGGASAGKAVDHANLGNVLTDDHHAKYTDAEAKTQAEGARLDDHAAAQDNTDLDAAAGQHGLMPKLDKIKLDASASAATASVLVIRDASSRSKFAAPGAAGDALIKGTRVTTAELPAMTDEKIWKGTGVNVEEIDVPSSTKEFFAAVPFGDNTDLAAYQVDVAADAGGDAFVSFKVPHDFSAITSADLIVVSNQSKATYNFDIDSSYGAEGEAYNVHAEADAGTTYNLTANQLYFLDISGILSALAAGDVVGIQIENNEGVGAQELYLIGVRFRYT